MKSSLQYDSHIRPELGLWDAISIIVGIVVGTSIYRATNQVFDNAGGGASALVLWLIGGAIAWCGAVCYAELATTYPRDGGDYEYLNRAFGTWCGFLFAWAQITAVISGNIAIMAYAFADYAGRIWPASPHHVLWWTLAPTIALSALNALGVVAGKSIQNALTIVKVIGLAGIVIAGIFASAAPGAHGAPLLIASGGRTTNLGLALIFVLYAYGGWTHAAYVAAEVRDQRRNLPRALTLGIVAITLIYLIVNFAYLHGLGFETARHSTTPASDILEHAFGPRAANAISLLVMLSALGAINGMVLTGTRIYAAWGADYRALQWLGRWNERRVAPVAAIVLQAIVATLLILLVGTQLGHGLFESTITPLGLTAPQWENFAGGFETLIAASAPVYWAFCLLTSLSVFILRRTDPNVPRPFIMPLYPLPALVFCFMCAFMFWKSIDYARGLSLLGFAPLPLGFLVWAALRASKSSVTQ